LEHLPNRQTDHSSPLSRYAQPPGWEGRHAGVDPRSRDFRRSGQSGPGAAHPAGGSGRSSRRIGSGPAAARPSGCCYPGGGSDPRRLTCIFRTRPISPTGHLFAGVLQDLTFCRCQTADAVPGDLLEDWIHLTGHEFGIGQFLRLGHSGLGAEGRFENPSRCRPRSRRALRPALLAPTLPGLRQAIPEALAAVVSRLDPEPAIEQPAQVRGVRHAIARWNNGEKQGHTHREIEQETGRHRNDQCQENPSIGFQTAEDRQKGHEPRRGTHHPLRKSIRERGADRQLQ